MVDRHRAAVVVAAPGAGKTTRIPPALLQEGPAIVLQPRRAAARAIAARIAHERNWALGREVGWHVRMERHFGPHTRLLIATEGILTARLQTDPLLSDFATVILDEFHERSIHADVAIALAKQALLARDDLRLLVMSATMDTERVAAYLNGCPVLRIDARTHPLTVDYAPGLSVATVVPLALRRSDGNVLCFEPGAAEITRTVAALRATSPSHITVLPLHGGLPANEQDAAIAGHDGRRIIVATNIAETSITVPGVTAVIDTGLEKVARYDPERGVDSLALERISGASADQRAGRAGRLGPGHVWRLWDERDRLTPYRTPDIHRIDLAGMALAILAWGGSPETLDWFQPPRPEDLRHALALLAALGATKANRITALGRAMVGLPLPPRLARVALAGHVHQRIAQAVAILADNTSPSPTGENTTSDLLPLLDRWSQMPDRIRNSARDIEQLLRRQGVSAQSTDEKWNDDTLRRALFAGFPDRVGSRRAPHSPRFLMCTGTGAVLGSESGVCDADFIVALELRASTHAALPESRIRLASAVEREWVLPTDTATEHALDEDGIVRARRVARYGEIRLSEQQVPIEPEVAEPLLCDAWAAQPRTETDAQLLRRLRFAGCTVDLPSLVRAAAVGVRRLADIDLSSVLTREQRVALEQQAPDLLPVPSGRQARLEYHEDGSVSAAIKLQELFGLADTPRLGPNRVPVLLSLLAPNGRPVQLTRDLKSFWDRTYPEVRKELRGRYPKHPWPDDPWAATPTHRAKPRQRK